MTRQIVAVFAAVAAVGLVLLVSAPPSGSQTPCEVALGEAAELEAVLDNNTTDGVTRRVNLENDLRNFIADVRAACAPPATTTTAVPTTTTAPPATTTTAPPSGACLPDPSLCGYPDADNTGPTGPLVSVDVGCGDYVVDTNGALVENLDIHGTLWVTGDNVTIRNVRVTTTCNWIAVGLQGTGDILEDSEVRFAGTQISYGYAVGLGTNSIVRRNDIHTACKGTTTGRSGWTVRDNWIHDLADPAGECHFGGMAFDGNQSNIDIVHNTIDINQDQTDAIAVANNDGPTYDVLIEDNLLAGGTYTVYINDQYGPGPITNVTMRGNRFGEHLYGYWYLRTPHPSIVIDGNVDDATGQPV